MENYIIEGTITEITNETANEVLFKLAGIENYALKINNKKYNVLCTEKLIKDSKAKNSEEEKESDFFIKTIVFSQDIQFMVTDMVKLFLIRSNGLGHHAKVKITGEFNIIEKEIENKKRLSVSSITLLAD